MLDTLTATQSLESVGFSPAHAQAIVAVVQSSEESGATKADLDSLKAELKADLARMETRLYHALWIQAGGIVGVLVGLIGTAIAVAYFLDRYLPEGALGS